MTGWVSVQPHWIIRPARGPHDGSWWVARCKHCSYSSGKKGSPGQAEQAVRAHFNDKHGGGASA